jgi:hypothetical protein
MHLVIGAPGPRREPGTSPTSDKVLTVTTNPMWMVYLITFGGFPATINPLLGGSLGGANDTEEGTAGFKVGVYASFLYWEWLT